VDDDGEHLHSVPLTAASVAKADCVVIVTDHSTIDYGLLAAHARCVVDTRNVLARRAR
jgi:UDP-N-acetyl-D-glucosamine dehydrogenase